MSKQWGIFDAAGVLHVIPIDDLEPHFKSLDCHCKPMTHPDTSRIAIIHNSFDGREKSEPGHSVKLYSDEEVRSCLSALLERGVDIDAIPGDRTVGYLFELLESVRPN